ncbi:hypothetical protein [Nonomuraea dietziae]|uniref:hypothetical protein n=1 Tax=Nonomuraea dietziae TaxID=65515 RepID=UPI00341CE659
MPVDLADPGAVTAAIARHRPAFVYVVSVANPTGAVAELSDVAERARVAGRAEQQRSTGEHALDP